MRRLERKTNPVLVALIRDLKKRSWEHGAPIWRDIARRLEGPARNWAEVNVGHIARFASEGATVVVPGKVLGSGTIDKKVTVAAWSFSKQAREKIAASGGKAVGIADLLDGNPKGSDCLLLG